MLFDCTKCDELVWPTEYEDDDPKKMTTFDPKQSAAQSSQSSGQSRPTPSQTPQPIIEPQAAAQMQIDEILGSGGEGVERYSDNPNPSKNPFIGPYQKQGISSSSAIPSLQPISDFGKSIE